MTSLHNALRDHTMPHKLNSHGVVGVYPNDAGIATANTDIVTNTKSTTEILSESRQMVGKLKANLKKDIEAFVEKEIEEANKVIEPQVAPPAPKSPRMKLPIAVPDPSQDTSKELSFKVPTSPRK